MNPRLVNIGVPAVLALTLVVCCWLVATADTVTPSGWYFPNSWWWL